MSNRSPGRVICLSSVYDTNYERERGDAVMPYLSSAKRRDLFDCLELATGREILVLSLPPKSLQRNGRRRLRSLTTTFGRHRQLFCGCWNVPKLRVLFGCVSYSLHVLRNTRSGDLVIIDNYIFASIVAAWVLKALRRVVFVLDYEDGHHVTARGAEGVLGRFAEAFGRRLINAAMLAQPALASRLPRGVPWEAVPGFVVTPSPRNSCSKSSGVRFLYSGSLDSARGIDVILQALTLLPVSGWSLDVTGFGPFVEQIRNLESNSRFQGRVRYHGTLGDSALRELYRNCDVGLNCQRSGVPVSDVTFPSKIFSYLSAGLMVISSRASEVPAICGKACRYYDGDNPKSLAGVMIEAIEDLEDFRKGIQEGDVAGRYSLETTAARLKGLLAKAGLS